MDPVHRPRCGHGVQGCARVRQGAALGDTDGLRWGPKEGLNQCCGNTEERTLGAGPSGLGYLGDSGVSESNGGSGT